MFTVGKDKLNDLSTEGKCHNSNYVYRRWRVPLYMWKKSCIKLSMSPEV